MISRKVMALSLCILVACAVWIHGDTHKNEDVEKQMEELQEQITKLEKRIEILEKQLKRLSKRSVEIPETFPKFQRMPKGWKQYEYNGIKFYIIPVKSDALKTNHQKQ